MHVTTAGEQIKGTLLQNYQTIWMPVDLAGFKVSYQPLYWLLGISVPKTWKGTSMQELYHHLSGK
ncbi:MAG TPA: hypothetical protein VK140_13345 [Ktedonobacteraceae bacterium]|nr:hypothetical protein [Ktedonobacteraceae bacterium]